MEEGRDDITRVMRPRTNTYTVTKLRANGVTVMNPPTRIPLWLKIPHSVSLLRRPIRRAA